MEKILKYSLILISLLISVGGIIYKLYALNNFGIFLNITIVFIIFIIIIILNKKVNFENNTTINLHSKNIFIPAIYLALTFGAFLILIKNATTDPIISPWTKIPNYFFIIYFTATVFLFLNILKKNYLSTLLLSIHYFLTFSIAIIIYKLGYGFDPYIHEATIKYIIEHGFITPKTFYYSGYYSLIITLNKLFFLPIFLLNKFIVPTLSAIFLPATLVIILKRWFNDEKKIKLSVLILLILPFNIFILSTPQNLSYLFLLLTVLFSLACKNYLDLVLIYLLAFSAFIIQPIAGIPALIIIAYVTVFNFNNKIKKYLYALLFFISSFSLPLLFLILNKNNLNFNNVEIFKKIINFSRLSLIFPHQENIWLNIIYLIGFNWHYLFLLLLSIGIFISWKNRKNFPHFFIYLLMTISSLISYFFIVLQPFSFLIDYERSDYANRLFVISAIFTIPFIILSFYKIIDDTLIQNKNIKIIFLFSGAIIISINLYLSYPRFDNYLNSRGISTGADDIEAVQWINNDTNDDYIVLANQQVGAATLHKFGFKKYYQTKDGAIFYYSIPTGGLLYQEYLKMIYEKPDKKNANKAMDIVGVKTAYFVLNKYWWAFPKILEEAKNEADSFKNINNEVYIFKYSKL